MIAVIRIKGMVNMNERIEDTLSRIRLRRKYSCVIVDGLNPLIRGVLQKLRSFVAYGEIDETTLKELVKKRGQLIEKNKKIDADKIAEQIIKNKNMKNLPIKPFFRLHPPRGGIDSKQHFPQGVLGNHGKNINNLIRRML